MHQIFSPDSKIMVVLNRIADLMILNILWLLFCLPIFSIGAATVAKYHVIFSFLHDTEHESVPKAFWHAFCRNFKPATSLFAITLIPLMLVIADILILLVIGINNRFFCYLSLLPASVLLLCFCYVYPLCARYDNTSIGTIRNAVVLSIANLPKSIIIVAINLSPIIFALIEPMLFVKFGIFYLLIGFSLMAYANAHILSKILD